jgi:peptidoglycan/LPS O-acetylase OafA/YrhL
MLSLFSAYVIFTLVVIVNIFVIIPTILVRKVRGVDFSKIRRRMLTAFLLTLVGILVMDFLGMPWRISIAVNIGAALAWLLLVSIMIQSTILYGSQKDFQRSRD